MAGIRVHRQCVTDLQEGEDEADSEVGKPVDGAGDHEGGGPGWLSEHLGSHHIRNGTWTDTDAVNHNQNSRDTSSLSHTVKDARVSNNRVQIYNKYHYTSGPIQTTLQLMEHPVVISVCINNLWWVRLTGSDRMSDDVDDDTGDADVGHPRDAPL